MLNPSAAVILSDYTCFTNLICITGETCALGSSAQVYNSFINKVHNATSRLQRQPTTVEEFADYLEVSARVRATAVLSLAM